MKRFFPITLLCLGFICDAFAAEPASYYLEDLTWPQVRERMQSGTNTIIIPTGGTEQNGPHVVIGKHNWIVRYTSGEIAKQLGNALAAPVLAYVPEGPIAPPSGHMLFPGTVSVREEGFALILEDAARSFKQHGFKHICFIGDHGGNQDAQAKIADKLTKEWKDEGVTVLQVGDYYTGKAADAWVAQQVADKKLQAVNGSAHGGFMDTSEVMAVDAKGVRKEFVKAYDEKDFNSTGVLGNPSEATAEYGKILLGFKVKSAVQQIQNAFPSEAK
jgi:creatinine amidohydrolase/Fe(II)-dependent formamide hydrolase-like protein